MYKKIFIYIEFLLFHVKHFLLIYMHTFCCFVRRKHVTRQYIQNKLNYHLIIFLKMNYFYFVNHLNTLCFYQY